MAVPLAAQSPEIANLTLIYLGERSGPLYDGLKALPLSDELSDLMIDSYQITPSTDSFARLAHLGLEHDSVWALTSRNSSGNEHCLLQGSKLPTAAEIRGAIDVAGIKSPLVTIRSFLKQHPDHLEARMALLHILRHKIGRASCRERV
jgi:hypothetical protein